MPRNPFVAIQDMGYADLSRLDKLYITLYTLNELNCRVSRKLLNAIRKEESGLYVQDGVSEQLFQEPEQTPENDGSSQGHHLMIYDEQGNCISRRRNADSFRLAIQTIGPQRLLALDVMIGTYPLSTRKPLKRKKYMQFPGGVYVFRPTTARAMCDVLLMLSETLGLGWRASLI